MRVTLFLLAIAAHFQLQAQEFVRQTTIQVTQNGVELDDPLAGGLNSCQVSTFDANLDGVKDLFVFDRNGGKFSVFVNDSSVPGTYSYRYTQQYNAAFPANLRNWVLLRDMNCDGREDICANSGSGFKIYLNTSTTGLSFDPTVNPNVMSYYEWDGSQPLISGVFCISPDVPAIDDYDNDGDMDMWSWNEFSSSLYFYKNMAMENGNCNAPDFICRNRCYGMFGESVESFSLIMGDQFECDFNVVNPRGDEDISGPLRHTGGTTTMYDLDNNGLKDLIIGDVSANTLTAIMLVESSTGQDSASVVHYDFPAPFGAESATNLITFLGSYIVDINNDGVRDMVVSPNADNDAADKRSVMLYINDGTNENPVFHFMQDNFLQSEMIDLGVGAYPTIADADGDGLKDLIVSNRKRFSLDETYASRLHFFKNTGSASEPAFDLADTNLLNIPSLQWLNIAPAMGDLDGDGDADLIVGDLDGQLHRFNNTSQAGLISFDAQPELISDSDGEIIDVGQSATPQVFDVDSDGKNDLLVGCLNGSVVYYHNVGTSQVPVFEWQTDSLGQAIALSLLGIQGKSVPCMTRDAGGALQLLLGTELGPIMKYGGIEGNVLGTFELITEDFEHIREGSRTAPASADLNGDGLNDLVIGNTGGGLAIWMHVPLQVMEMTLADEVNVFPNPSNGSAFISLPQQIRLPIQLSIFDMQGRIVHQQTLTNLRNEINVDALVAGGYLVHLQSNSFVAHKRLVIRK